MIEIPKHILGSYFLVKETINETVDHLVKPGLKVKWKHGKYKGREAIVDKVIWEESWRTRDAIDILVLVKTIRIDEKGFIEDNDHVHRCYRDINLEFEVVK